MMARAPQGTTSTTLPPPMRARSTLAALGAAVVVLALAPGAHAAIAYAPCDPAGFQCGQLAVPIDRAGVVPGTLTLNAKRVVASSNPTATAVVALAGGPGQAAIPVATEFASILGPALATRDLLVYDQRGTGSSGRLTCPAFERSVTSIVEAAAACANQLGAARGFYRTSDSVDDIEALRVESGYQKLVLFGVSYGTKVALDYAAKYPANVESLVLDSVVPPEGSDVLNISTFKTMPRALGELCSNGGCSGITTNVGHDLFNLVHKTGRKPIAGKVNTPGGRSLKVRLDQDGVLDILLGGDLNPTLRSELPGAMRSAIKDDTRPLLRLLLRAKGLTGIPDARSQGNLDEADSDALFVATRCEESAFPWDRNAGAEQRASQALSGARAHPSTDFQPFNYRVALRSESVPVCLAWPNASPPPAPPTALPQVPTLILSGGFDLRTPREDAASVAARIPGAQLVAVPYTGHSVVTSDLSDCAKNAVAAFFAGQPVAQCANPKQVIPPSPVAPTRLSRLRGRTKALKTVAAVTATVRDVKLQFLGDEIAAGRATPSGAKVAGLRSGHATATSRGYNLRRVEFVPGVIVSGVVPAQTGSSTLTISGRAAPHGSLTFHPDGTVTGRLAGRKVSAPAARAARAVTRPLPVRLPRYRRLLQLG
jgi:pimeloyl-ACP methyl ester carboxylesterase